MVKIEDVIAKIHLYENVYRNDKLARLDISDEYDLFPTSYIKPSNGRWPDTYPNNDAPGIYIILSESHRLLYIGKASMGNTIGSRLGSYFMYDLDGKSCKIRHKWTEMPKYIVTVAVPNESPFEAPAIEEFLISTFKDNLPDNMLGKK